MKKLHIVIIAAALLAIAGGVSYAAIPSADGTISACRDSQGRLKVIDTEAGQSCPSNQQLLTWNQQGPTGPPGPSGPPGSVRAYAEVDAWGNVTGGNLTDANIVKLGTGQICFGRLGFTPQVALVTLGNSSTVDGTPTARVYRDIDSTCPIGFRDVYVVFWNEVSLEFDDEEFYILIN